MYVSQINLCQLLFRATLTKSGYAHVCHYSWNGYSDSTNMNAHFKKFTAGLQEGLIHEWRYAFL